MKDHTAVYSVGERVRTGRKDENGNLQPPILTNRGVAFGHKIRAKNRTKMNLAKKTTNPKP